MKRTMVNLRSLLTGVFIMAALIAGPESPHAASDAAALTPKGELRVGLSLSNPALVSRDPQGQFQGVGIELANALAEKLGVKASFVPYDNQTRYNLSIGKDEWDIALGPRDLSRTDQLAFSTPFMEADNGYVARAGMSLTTAQDVDRAGIKVAVAQGSAADGYLTRTLKNAEIVRVLPGPAAAREALSFGRADVYAESTSQAYRIAAEVPGATVLIGRFNVVQFSIAIPKNNLAALPILNQFVLDAKKPDGAIGKAIKGSGLSGIRPAR
jgi:polar amino acid transport system substrate-binding protein